MCEGGGVRREMWARAVHLLIALKGLVEDTVNLINNGQLGANLAPRSNPNLLLPPPPRDKKIISPRNKRFISS